MTRNTLRRVEVSVPIFNSKLREELKEMFGLMLSDNVKARELGADGTYRKVSTGDTQLNSQEVLFQDCLRLCPDREREANVVYELEDVLQESSLETVLENGKQAVILVTGRECQETLAKLGIFLENEISLPKLISASSRRSRNTCMVHWQSPAF